MLYVREWLFVSLILFLLATHTSLSFAKKNSYPALDEMRPIQVYGAVKEEGTYYLPIAAKVSDLVSKIEFTDDADIDALFIHQPIKDDYFIVPKKNTTTIYLSGAVSKSGPYDVPKGTRVCDLVGLLPLDDEADLRPFLRKRRRVLQGERIEVEKKQKK